VNALAPNANNGIVRPYAEIPRLPNSRMAHFLRTIGMTNIAEALRRNAAQVDEVLARVGIFKKQLALAMAPS
jgi:hypothetical protein